MEVEVLTTSEIESMFAELGSRTVTETTNSEPATEITTQEAVQEEQDTQELPNEESDEEVQSPVFTRNPDLSLLREEYSRFSGAEWFRAFINLRVTVVGVGGIGSWTAFLISRLCPSSIGIYDSDYIEASNISGQFYNHKNIGEPKASVCANIIRDFSNYYSVFSHNERFTSNSTCSPITLCCVDNMSTRKIVYEKWKKVYKGCSDAFFVDGRLAAEKLQVFSFTGKDGYYMSKYENEWLFSDEEAEETTCSYRQTSFCAAMIGSIITNIVVNFCCVYNQKESFRELPFMTSYDATLMSFKLEK